MTTVKRIARNATLLLLAQIVGYALGFFYIIYTARYLGAEDFGVLSFALALTAIFAILTDIGLQPLTVREVARDKTLASKYLANLTFTKIILSVITFALIAIVINVMDYPIKTVATVYIVTLSILVTSFTTMIYSIFQAYERMEFQSAGLIINSSIMLVGAIIAIKINLDVRAFAALYLLSSTICLFYSIAIVRINFKEVFIGWLDLQLHIDPAFLRTTIKKAVPFGFGVFFVLMFYWIDSVMLSYIKGDAAVGWYNAPFRIVLVLLLIPQSLIVALYPVMSKFYNTSEDSLTLSFQKSLKYLAMLGLPIGVAITLLAKQIILLTFGQEYINSVAPLQILVWSSVLIFVTMPFGNLLNCQNKQLVVTKVCGLYVPLNIILNLILIPRYSLIGAGIATVLTQLFGSFLLVYWTLKVRSKIYDNKAIIILSKFLVSSLIMGLFILYFQYLSLIIILPLAGLLYFLVLFIIKGIDSGDLTLLKSVIQRT
ncbi:hypothetical protein MNBD_DELTA01-1967 [hydrothermal vent metagenome]|uniref:Uncharacterized protein n=1 Tax=hydrothermal vent metagenome TaxID=652676 RepID=A0A3B0R0J6_9ZZZZ